MHELHLAEDILEKAKAKAEEQGLTRFSKAKVKLGESRFTDLLELKDMLARVAAGIEFEIEVVPLKASCAKCGKEFSSKVPRLDCPHCGDIVVHNQHPLSQLLSIILYCLHWVEGNHVNFSLMVVGFVTLP